jgi:DNA-binding NarL/FixJ family response regulator
VSRATATTARSASKGSTADAVGPVALIADEGPRERIADLLVEQGVEHAAFDDVESLLEHHGDDPPALVLLWIDATAVSPADPVERLHGGVEQAPIVMICAGVQRWEVRAALSAGAAGVVLEDELDGALGPCMRAVRAGQICVPREHWRQIEPPALSTREKQILGLVVMGYMNSQIAERLFLAESTVKSHLSSAFGKLGVRSRNEAVNLILDSKRGLGMGILGLGSEPLQTTSSAAR